jgi:NADH-quinone oxidoreductase subunit C
LSERIQALGQQVDAHLQSKGLQANVKQVPSLADELAYEVEPQALLAVCRVLRDTPELKFEILVDVAGVDYLQYGRDEWQTESATNTGFSRGRKQGMGVQELPPPEPRRFSVSYHLLSIANNQRLRLRVNCPDENEPVVDSLVDIWASANWFEREAFDLFGILFRGHPDLRRLLTDYGFVGYPFRKDFPLIGNVEVRYDPEKKRVVYEPVGIEPRVLVPKVIRDDSRYNPALKDVQASQAPRP